MNDAGHEETLARLRVLMPQFANWLETVDDTVDVLWSFQLLPKEGEVLLTPADEPFKQFARGLPRLSPILQVYVEQSTAEDVTFILPITPYSTRDCVFMRYQSKLQELTLRRDPNFDLQEYHTSHEGTSTACDPITARYHGTKLLEAAGYTVPDVRTVFLVNGDRAVFAVPREPLRFCPTAPWRPVAAYAVELQGTRLCFNPITSAYDPVPIDMPEHRFDIEALMDLARSIRSSVPEEEYASEEMTKEQWDLAWIVGVSLQAHGYDVAVGVSPDAEKEAQTHDAAE